MVPEAADGPVQRADARKQSGADGDSQRDIHHHNRMLRAEADAAGEAEDQRARVRAARRWQWERRLTTRSLDPARRARGCNE